MPFYVLRLNILGMVLIAETFLNCLFFPDSEVPQQADVGLRVPGRLLLLNLHRGARLGGQERGALGHVGATKEIPGEGRDKEHLLVVPISHSIVHTY